MGGIKLILIIGKIKDGLKGKSHIKMVLIIKRIIKIEKYIMQDVEFELHFAFFYKVQLEVDSILRRTTLKLKMKEE